jgi:Family of unknown function (DUF5681)
VTTDDASNAGPKAGPKRTGAPPWPKGKSGNPAGARKGSKHRRTLLLAAMSNGDRADIVEKIIRQAKRGDRASQRLIVDRTEPPRRGSPVKFALPDIVTIADVVAAQRAITVAMSKGRLTPAEAVEVSGVVELARRALETSQLEARLAAIETMMGDDNDEKKL